MEQWSKEELPCGRQSHIGTQVVFGSHLLKAMETREQGIQEDSYLVSFFQGTKQSREKS